MTTAFDCRLDWAVAKRKQYRRAQEVGYLWEFLKNIDTTLKLASEPVQRPTLPNHPLIIPSLKTSRNIYLVAIRVLAVKLLHYLTIILHRCRHCVFEAIWLGWVCAKTPSIRHF
jgi:hypothetical protein